MALSNRDKNLIEAFWQSCQFDSVPDTAQFWRGGDAYYMHRFAFLIKPAEDAEKATMTEGTLYPYIKTKPLKAIKDITRCDPSVSLSGDGVTIPDIRTMQETEFIATKANTGGAQDPFLYFLKDAGTHKFVIDFCNLQGSSLSMLPMRPYKFKKETMAGNYDGCTFHLHVFLPLNAPIVVIHGDVVRLYCMTDANFKDILYKPVLLQNGYYKLDGWRHSDTPGSSSYQYFKKLKGKDTMNLPKLGSPLKNNKPATAPAAPAQSPTLEEAAAEPAVPPVRALPKRRPAPAPAPAPEPAGAPGDSVTVEELQQRQAKEPQVETFEQPINAMEQPMEDPAEPVTVAEEQTDIPKDRVTQPDREMTQAEYAALKKRTRKPAPVAPIGFDFGPVIEYTGSALPEDLTADQIEAEARSLRDLGINIQRRQANLIFAMRKTGSAAEAKLKALSDLIGK